MISKSSAPDATSVRCGLSLLPFLERLVERYHRPEFLGTDPLALVHEFGNAADREIAALFAALLAYGNVKQIQKSLRTLFAAMDNQPDRFVHHFDYSRAARQIGGFKHRFTDSEDILCLCCLLHQLIGRHGSLEAAFAAGYQENDPDLTNAAAHFVDSLHSMDFAPHFERERMLAKSSFKHLIPRADRGSACKRIHLFLRWMIRPDDSIDLGLWKSFPKEKLLVPVDTHVLRIARNLGIVTVQSNSLSAARQITSALREANAADPVQYDFSLCRIGIVKACPTRAALDVCRPCELHDICLTRRKLEKQQRR